MKNNAKSDYSIRFVDKALTYISNHANLNEPEQVKQFIANLNVTNGYKKNLCLAYNKYCKHYQIEWKMPIYRPEQQAIKIPTNEKIEMLIASAGRTLSTTTNQQRNRIKTNRIMQPKSQRHRPRTKIPLSRNSQERTS
jgi:hypothetical protein